MTDEPLELGEPDDLSFMSPPAKVKWKMSCVHEDKMKAKDKVIELARALTLDPGNGHTRTALIAAIYAHDTFHVPEFRPSEATPPDPS